MNTILIDKKGCKMIAHRGVSGLEKEEYLRGVSSPRASRAITA